MLANFHTHSTFCDGKNSPREIIESALNKGFSQIGFSGHGYTPFDLRYCMKETSSYIAEIKRLKLEFKDKIEVYLGVEEDAFYPLNRNDFDYIIGSSHYFKVNEKYYPIDSNYDCFKRCLEVFNYDTILLAQTYYTSFVDYIEKRKPDIVGHFDLITKFDEIDKSLFLGDKKYNQIAEKFIEKVIKSECIFEVNTGAIARGLRSSVYPAENLLYKIKKGDGKLILSSDSHAVDTLDFGFKDIEKYLKNVGFNNLYTLKGGKFIKYEI